MPTMRRLRIGVIAEDKSDVESARVLIRRITQREDIGVRHFIGTGCGKIKRKANSWAQNLRDKGCRLLILIHDLDRAELDKLQQALKGALDPCPMEPYLICIPVEEMEAWWLSDPQAIKRALSLPRAPKIKGHPESISSPKEHLAKLVRRCSNNKKTFLNTKHNAIIAGELDLKKARKCSSFVPFYDFVESHVGSHRAIG